jgi:hypothetical protein
MSQLLSHDKMREIKSEPFTEVYLKMKKRFYNATTEVSCLIRVITYIEWPAKVLM